MSDRILGALALLGAVAMAIAAWGYAAPIDYEPVGPRAFPLLLATLIAACGAWLLVKPGAHAAFPSMSQLRNIALCACTVLAYGILFQWLGFILATAMLAIPVGRVFGGSWRQSVATGAALGVVGFLFFDKLLDVVLPLGVLKPLFAAMGA